MAKAKQIVFLGTELKLNINIAKLEEFTMDDYDFNVEVYCSAKRVITITKEEAIRIDENNYVILIDSGELGAGDVKCKVTAYVPDYDFPDTLRTEIVGVDAGVTIVKTI